MNGGRGIAASRFNAYARLRGLVQHIYNVRICRGMGHRLYRTDTQIICLRCGRGWRTEGGSKWWVE